jgi:excisionase family DNA binding protein
VEPNLLYRPREAAALLGISRATLYRLVAAGRLRAVRIGRAALIPREELARFVRELQAGGAS